MRAEFQYDVFLSHSAKDKPVVRSLAERLRADGLKVWFDEWVLKPGDSIPAKIEAGLEHSRAQCAEQRKPLPRRPVTGIPSTLNSRPSTSPRRFLPLQLDASRDGCGADRRLRIQRQFST